MTRVAIPVENQVLCSHFGACMDCIIVEIDHKRVQNMKRATPTFHSIDELSLWIYKWGITDIIAHGMDKNTVQFFSNTKINLFVGISIATPEHLIDEYLKGTLRSNAQNILKS